MKNYNILNNILKTKRAYNLSTFSHINHNISNLATLQLLLFYCCCCKILVNLCAYTHTQTKKNKNKQNN